MKKPTLISIVLPAILLAAAGAPAQEPAPLTLAQARSLAIEHHPRITTAELVALAAKQEVREERAGFFPILTADATAVGTTSESTRIAAGALNNPLILERNAEGVNVSQLITDFGRTANLTSSSKLHARAQDENTIATRAQILLAVDSAYFGALQAQSVLEVADQTVKTRQLIYDQVSGLASNGMKSTLDVSFARVDLESSKLLLANANNDLSAAFATLVNVLGERDSKIYRLADEPLPTRPDTNEVGLVQTALRERPDLVQLRYEHDAALKFASAEHELHYPTISAVGAAGVMPTHDPALKANYAAAGVNLSLPIFDGLLFSAREQAAQLRAKAAGEDLRDAENNVVRDVRIAALNLSYAAERMDLTAKLLESASEAFDLAQALYKVGTTSIVELSQAQLNKTEAQIAQARAKYEYQTRRSVLDFQTGQLR